MSQNYLAVFAELIRTAFQHLELVWGIYGGVSDQGPVIVRIGHRQLSEVKPW
jgi:hypothetical protein